MTVERLAPPVTPGSAPFWDATVQRQFLLPWCRECEHAFWFPREVCPGCLGAQIDWRPASGRGRVHAVSVTSQPAYPGLKEAVPYAVALIDLDEDVRMMAGLISAEPDQIAVGDPVTLAWEALPDGRNLPMFECAQ